MQAPDIIPCHPYSNKFPLLNGAEFKDLVADIGANGLHEPITLYQGKILDGRNRYRACMGAKVEPRLEQFKGDDAAALAFVISKNIRRRHLKVKEKDNAIAELLKLMPEKSDRQISKETGVSNTHVGKVRKELEKSGDVSIVDTRTDTKGRKQPAKKVTKTARAAAASQTMPGTIGPMLPNTLHARYLAAGEFAPSTVGSLKANGVTLSAATEIDALRERVREQERLRLAAESRIQELEAENAKLREQLKAACAHAHIPEKQPSFELEPSPISN